MILATSGLAKDLVPILICVTVIVVAVVGGYVLTRSTIPASRRYPSPRRQLSNDREYYRAWRYRNRRWRATAFTDMTLPPPELAPPADQWLKDITELIAKEEATT